MVCTYSSLIKTAALSDFQDDPNKNARINLCVSLFLVFLYFQSPAYILQLYNSSWYRVLSGQWFIYYFIDHVNVHKRVYLLVGQRPDIWSFRIN